MTAARWYAKANALQGAWRLLFGADLGEPGVCLALSVAQHETQCGDAWPGTNNWGAVTRRALSQGERIAVANVHPVIVPSAARVLAEAGARKAIADAVAAGTIPDPGTDVALFADSSPTSGAYFTWFAKEPSEQAGASYFVRVLAMQRATCRAVLEAAKTPILEASALARAMYATHYYTGFRLDDPDGNIADYSRALVGILPEITDALAAWSYGASPPPFDVSSTSGVQDALNKLGFGPLDVDGVLGPKTQAAIRGFQSSHRLKADGVVGPKTRAALLAALTA